MTFHENPYSIPVFKSLNFIIALFHTTSIVWEQKIFFENSY